MDIREKFAIGFIIIMLIALGYGLVNELYTKDQPIFKVGDCVVQTFKGGEFTETYVSPFVKKIQKIGKTHYLYKEYYTFTKEGQIFYDPNFKLDDAPFFLLNNNHILVECNGLP